MSRTLRMLLCFEFIAALWATRLVFAAPTPLQDAPQASSPSAEKAAAYFPSGVFDSMAFYISDFLSRAGEPSLLAAGENPNSVCYRFNAMEFVPEQMVAVRLCLNPDGTARIFSTQEFGTPRVPHRSRNTVSVADVHRFLQRVDKADFWSMPANEPESPDPRRRTYKMDASVWIFEGVRGGTYHVVLRRAQESSRFTEMVSFLTKDLAKLNDSAVPRVARSNSR